MQTEKRLKTISRIICAVRFICASFSTVLYTCLKMPRRNRIPIEHRERIVCAFEDETEDYLLLADTLGVNRSTAIGIPARYIRKRRIRERPRGGRNNVLVDDEMRQCLEEIINENCVLTLSQINGELRRRLPAKPLIHGRTIARNLEGMLFRVKLVWHVPADRNRPGILQRRQEYGNWFMNHAIMCHCVFIDECGYNIWTARNHGRARQGECAYRQVCGQRGRNVTLALDCYSMLFSAVRIGVITAAKAYQWFTFMQTYLPRCLNGEEIEG